MITRIDHIGIAVKALEKRLPFWSEALGMDVRNIETVEQEKVKVAFLPAGDAHVELLEATSPDSPIAKFIDKRGEGIHHLTLAVRDLPQVLEKLAAAGVPILGEGIHTGAGGRDVAFLHPKASGGVLVELVSDQTRLVPKVELVPGAAILVNIREPQEKLWGVLRRLDATGVQLEGIELGSFDDWVAQIEVGDPSVVGPSLIFIPMTRVERILLDRSSGDLPSLAERFERRTGKTVQSVLEPKPETD